jgi:hypothetical protein
MELHKVNIFAILFIIMFIVVFILTVAPSKIKHVIGATKESQEYLKNFEFNGQDAAKLAEIQLDYELVDMKTNMNIPLLALLSSYLAYQDISPFTQYTMKAFEQVADEIMIIDKEKMRAFLMVKGQTCYIGFEGTTSLVDVINDTVAFVDRDFHNVHSGFYNAAQSVFPELLTIFRDLKKKYDIKNVITSGHSLGASVSQVISVLLGYYAHPDLNVYNVGIGTPKSGEVEFKEIFNKSIKQCIAFDNTGDPVTDLNLGEYWSNACEEVLFQCSDEKPSVVCHSMSTYAVNILKWILEKDPDNQYAKLLIDLNWSGSEK